MWLKNQSVVISLVKLLEILLNCPFHMQGKRNIQDATSQVTQHQTVLTNFMRKSQSRLQKKEVTHDETIKLKFIIINWKWIISVGNGFRQVHHKFALRFDHTMFSFFRYCYCNWHHHLISVHQGPWNYHLIAIPTNSLWYGWLIETNHWTILLWGFYQIWRWQSCGIEWAETCHLVIKCVQYCWIKLYYFQTFRFWDLVLQERTTGSNIWESFQHPSNAMLPNMKLRIDKVTGKKVKLTSWKSPSDPHNGSFSLSVERLSIPEVFIWNQTRPLWRTNPWNGKEMSNTFFGK